MSWYECAVARRGCYAHDPDRRAPSVQPTCRACGVDVCAGCSTRVSRNVDGRRCTLRICLPCHEKAGTFLCTHCGLSHHESNCWVRAERRERADKHDRWVDENIGRKDRSSVNDLRARVARKLRRQR